MFQGFSDETVDFMWGLRFNNERSWFEAHKETYLRTFSRPMRELAQEVFQRFRRTYPDLDVMCKVSRIYRDARRLYGRGPYKDHLWFSIRRPDTAISDTPVLWFELEPEGWSHGMGYYSAAPLTMAKFRARLDRDPEGFRRLIRPLKRQDTFRLEGEDYRRPKGSGPAGLEEWYNKRRLSLMAQGEHGGILYTPQLVEHLTEGFEFLQPYYAYFASLSGDPDPRTEG